LDDFEALVAVICSQGVSLDVVPHQPRHLLAMMGGKCICDRRFVHSDLRTALAGASWLNFYKDGADTIKVMKTRSRDLGLAPDDA
jgi:hypothetical protein